MEQDKYYFRVGIFVTIIIVAAIFTLSWFATNRNNDTYLTYAISFEGAVDGLSVGSPITYKGIDVGHVRDISFSSYDGDLISVLVDIVDTAPVRKDTVASLKLQGITGTSIIALNNTNAPDDPIEYLTKQEGQEYLVIESQQSKLVEVFTSIPELIAELKTLSVQGQSLLSEENIKVVNLMLSDFRGLLASSQVTMREIKMLARTLREDPSQVIRGSEYKGYEVTK